VGSTPASAEAVAPSRARRRVRLDLLPYLMVGPAVLAVLALTVYPALYAVRLSTTDANLIRFAAAQPVGLGNYAKAFADEIFVGSLGRTLRYVVAVAGTQMLLALPVALFLNTAFLGRGLVRSAILIPWVVPGAVAAIIWRFLVHPNLGLVNDLLLRLGLISEYLIWIADPVRSFVVVVVATLWSGFPFFAIMLLAALQAIPGDLYEASRVDGAGAWQRFRHVTLPLLWPSMLLLLLLRTIGLAHGVDLIFLLTGGGPGYDNYTVAVYSFILAWNQFELGYASALAVMLSLVLLAVSAVYVWLIERSRAWM
jgi:multiple sugar transport system permease protein